jgi:prephenate dehydrogenase
VDVQLVFAGDGPSRARAAKGVGVVEQPHPVPFPRLEGDADVLGVVGTGHIGGSIVRRAHERRPRVVAYDRDAQVRAAVRALDVEVVDDLESLAGAADLVAIAIPPSHTVEAWQRLASAPRTRDRPLVVVDVASVKRPLLDRLSPRGDAPWAVADATFALTHPMAGRETSGFEAALDDLFVGAAWLVCPHPAMRGDALARILAFVTAMGADPGFFDPDRHDRFAALVSHLPHLLAFCYQDLVDDIDPTGNWQRFGGGSLADLLRVADADPALWAEILGENREEIDAALDELVVRLRAGYVPREPPRAEPPAALDPVAVPLDDVLAPGTIESLIRAGDAGCEVVDAEIQGDDLVLRFGRRALR